MACVASEITAPPHLERASSSERIPSLDGIRGLAILMVLSWHGIFGWLRPATHPLLAEVVRLGRLTWSGVDLFFVLSGFLIGGILLDARDSERYFAPFYIRRAHRILPLYFALLAIVFFVVRFPVLYYGTFLQNFWMATRGNLGPGLLGMTWSLAVEEQFYLTLPAVIRYASRRSLWWVVSAMILGAPLLRMALNPLPHGTLASTVLAPCRADALGFGVLGALLARTPRLWNALCEKRRWLYGALVAAFLPIAYLLHVRYESLTGRFFGLEYSALALFYFLLLLSVLVSDKLRLVFSWRGLTYAGTIAYGLYLLHQPLMEFVRTLTHRALALGGLRDPVWIYLPECAVGIGLAFVAAAISWTYLEKPLIRRGHRFQYQERASVPLPRSFPTRS